MPNNFFFLGPHLQHMEVSRLGVESELQPPAYARATAMWDLSHICDLHHSSRQCRIPDLPVLQRVYFLRNCKYVFKSLFFFFFFFLEAGVFCSMWKILGQGFNLGHSGDLSCCSDNPGSLTHRTREQQKSYHS